MNKKLLTAVLVPLMLMLVASFGYAAWTDSIAIYTTATTGDVEFRILAIGVWNSSAGLSFSASGVGESPYEAVNLAIRNTYPGSWAFIWLKVKNTGTISIKLYRMRIVCTGGNADWKSYYRFAIPTQGDLACEFGPPVYFENDLNWWSTWRYYTAGGDLATIPVPPIAPEAEYVLGGYFKLADNAPQVENNWISVSLELEVIQAVP